MRNNGLLGSIHDLRLGLLDDNRNIAVGQMADGNGDKRQHGGHIHIPANLSGIRIHAHPMKFQMRLLNRLLNLNFYRIALYVESISVWQDQPEQENL